MLDPKLTNTCRLMGQKYLLFSVYKTRGNDMLKHLNWLYSISLPTSKFKQFTVTYLQRPFSFHCCRIFVIKNYHWVKFLLVVQEECVFTWILSLFGGFVGIAVARILTKLLCRMSDRHLTQLWIMRRLLWVTLTSHLLRREALISLCASHPRTYSKCT